MYPITHCIPTCKIVETVPNKEKEMAQCDPRDARTYIFKNEKDYYKDYQKSKFGVTKCKAGWDCFRHYEILANGCLPLFLDVEKCPPNTCTHLPKERLKYILKHHKDSNFDYDTIANEMLEYTKRHLSTKAMAQYMLDTLQIKCKKILFLAGKKSRSNYMRDCLLVGFKELLGVECHDYPEVSFLYKDCPDDKIVGNHRLWGKGMGYTKIIDRSLRKDISESEIRTNIVNKEYDLIIYANIFGRWEEPPLFMDIVCEHYDKSKIVMICGNDKNKRKPTEWYANQGHPCFVRELI